MKVKSLLARFATRKALGVYIDDHAVVVSKAAATPVGPVQISCRREQVEPGQLTELLHRLLGQHLGWRKAVRIPVAIGIPSERVFFSTRPIRATNQDASPKALLHEVLQASSVSIDEMVVDVIKSATGSRSLARIASCSKRNLTELLEPLERSGVRPVRAEPAPCALLRVAAEACPAPRRSKVVLRIFLGDTRGLAVLATPHVPAVWRYFELPRGNEGCAIVSITRSLQALSKPCGISAPLDAVLIHGRNDLRTLLELEGLAERVGISLTWCAGPALDSAAIAYGLALGGLTPDATAFDLAQTLKRPATLWDLFPWGELALKGSLVFCMGLLLANRASAWDRASTAVETQIAQNQWLASATDQELENERKNLTRKVEAIRKFVASRVTWTNYTHDIPASLPPSATISSMHGACELEAATKKSGNAKLKKSFVIRGAAPIAKNGSVPHQIDEFMDRLRENDDLKRDFPEVELADIKWFQPIAGTAPHAQFTIVCLPKPNKTKTQGHEESDEHTKESEN